MPINQTEITATNWIDRVIKERGIKQARQIMTYNITKNPFFHESICYINAVWKRINEIEDSI